MCSKGLNEAFGEKLFNFILFSFGYSVIYHHFFILKFLFFVSLV